MAKFTQDFSFDNLPISELLEVQSRIADSIQPLIRVSAQISDIMPPSILVPTQLSETLLEHQTVISDMVSSMNNIYNSQTMSNVFEMSQLCQSIFAGIKIFDTILAMNNILRTIDFEELYNIVADWEIDELEVGEISAETAQTFQEEITEVFADQQNWQQKLMTMCLKYQETNPILAWAFRYILVGILVGVAASYIMQMASNSKVRELPTSTSNVIYQVTEESNIIVIGDVPYYYEVEFENPETGEAVRGYVSKRSISALEKQEDTTDANT